MTLEMWSSSRIEGSPNPPVIRNVEEGSSLVLREAKGRFQCSSDSGVDLYCPRDCGAKCLLLPLSSATEIEGMMRSFRLWRC